MPIKKSELYSSSGLAAMNCVAAWMHPNTRITSSSCLFMKYVSDKAVSQKGYLLDVPKGGSFADMVALKVTRRSAIR